MCALLPIFISLFRDPAVTQTAEQLSKRAYVTNFLLLDPVFLATLLDFREIVSHELMGHGNKCLYFIG